MWLATVWSNQIETNGIGAHFAKRSGDGDNCVTNLYAFNNETPVSQALNVELKELDSSVGIFENLRWL